MVFYAKIVKEDDYFIVSFPQFENINTYGETKEEAVKSAEAALGEEGRILLRPSGTEPLLRVMVEGKEGDLVRKWAETIAEAVKDATRQAA